VAKWGFDLDGTLDHLEIRALANFLYDHGEEVHVLTGFLPGGAYSAEQKVAKLERLGCRYTQIHLCPGESMAEMGQFKAAVLNRLGIWFMVDDDPTFVRQMAYYANSRILMVVK
jgi:hypothetical protein